MAGLGLQLPYAGQSLDDMLQKLTETQAATKLANAKLAIEQQNADTERQRTMADMLHQHTMDALSEKIRTAAEQEKSDALGAKSIMGQSSETPLTPDQYGVAARSGISLKPIVTGSTNFALPFGGTVPIPTNVAAGRGLTDKEQSDQDATDAIDALNLPSDQKVRLRATLRHPELGAALNSMNKTGPYQQKDVLLDGKPDVVNFDPTTGQSTKGGVDVSDRVKPIPPASATTSPAASDAALQRSYQFATGEIDKRRGTKDQLGKIDQALGVINQQTPQADALIAPAVISAAVGGQGSGVRVTQAEINATTGGRSVWEGLKAALQKWNTDPSQALAITPDQRQQLRELMTMIATKAQAREQILTDAGSQLSTATDPKQHRTILADVDKKLLAMNSGGGSSAPKEKTLPNGQVLQQQSDGTWKIIR